MIIQDFSKKITWLGHDGFRIDAKKTVYLDPYGISGGPEADLILISHDHFDHCSPEDVAKIQGTKTVIITEKDSAKKLSGDVRIVKPGESLNVDDIKIQAVPSYNTDKDFHPKANAWLGFIVEIEGVTIYHAGDSDFIPEMKGIKADVAFLPVCGTYMMSAEDAVKAANIIKPKVAVPFHWGSVFGSKADAVKFKSLYSGKSVILEME